MRLLPLPLKFWNRSGCFINSEAHAELVMKLLHVRISAWIGKRTNTAQMYVVGFWRAVFIIIFRRMVVDAECKALHAPG